MAAAILLPVVAFAQTAPDIAVGTSVDAVIRTYGWPKGRSVTENRESWVYDTFQVTFENGHVLRVVPLPLGNKQRKQPVVPRGINSKPSPLSNEATTNRAPPFSQNPAPQPSRLSVAPSSQLSPERPVNSLRERAVPQATTETWFRLNIFLPAFVLVAAGIVARIIVVSRRWEKQEIEERAALGRALSKGAKSWKDEVGAVLEKANGLTAPGAGRPSAVAPGIKAASFTDLSIELLREIEWLRFEKIVALYYGETGVRAECTCLGPDGGIDVKLFRPGEERAYCYVQCKAWGADKVPVTKVRELFGVMAADKVNEGVFVTTSDFWPDARAFAVANGIVVLTAADFVQKFQELPIVARTRILAEVTAGDYTTPSCPTCGIKMIWRAGEKPFWGCRTYRKCGSKPIYPRTT